MLAGVVGSVLGIGALLVPAATASTDNADAAVDDQALASSTEQATADTPHCAVQLAPEGSADAAEVEQRCFERFADAVAYGTDGEVRLPPDAGPRALDLDSEVVTASALLGVLYGGTGYDGASKVLNGTGDGCYAGRTYKVKNLASVNFDNRASSFKVRSNCLGRVYAGKNLSGAKFLCENNCSSLGNLNNRGSSIKFF